MYQFHQTTKNICFWFNGDFYQYRSLPFGLSSAPRVFTKLCRVAVSQLRANGISVVIYIDDVLVFAPTYKECKEAVNTALKWFCYLGFVINLPKSSLEPSQTIEYLGLIWDSVRYKVSVSDDRVLRALDRCNELLLRKNVSLKSIACLLSTFTSMLLVYPDAPLRYRSLQHLLNAKLPLIRSAADYATTACLSDACREDLEWWTERLARPLSRSLSRVRASRECFSDASDVGWGAVAYGVQAGFPWRPKERRLHINERELLAVFYMLQMPEFQGLICGKVVNFNIDNMTAVAYLNKRGGRIQRLSGLTMEIFACLHDLNVTPLFTYLPTSSNYDADSLSRNFRSSLNWCLSVAARNYIFERLGCPEIDLFATACNAVVPRFYSWHHDYLSDGSDALKQNWQEFMLAYAFPPVSMIPAVISKIQTEPSRLIIVFPYWESQPWFPVLMRHVHHSITVHISDIREGTPNGPPISETKKWTFMAAVVSTVSCARI